MGACRPWLETEIRLVKPALIVCLGATAAQSLLGAAFRITKQRGQMITDTPWAPAVTATYHPSALLRIPDEAGREKAFGEFVDDLKKVAKAMKTLVNGQGKPAQSKGHADVTSEVHPSLFGDDARPTPRGRHA